jgi:anti-sigma regulatory factor (Ser/Thr protein kinase)
MFLPPDFTAPSLARDAAVRLASAVPEETLDDMRLVVSELVTNAVQHADLQGEETIGLDIDVESERVDVIVRYPEHRGFERVLSLEPGETSGWGLFLVDRIADRWSVVATQGFTEAWCELRR